MTHTAGFHHNTIRLAAWGLATALLLAPLVAMQFTSEVRWGAGDFAAGAILLGGAGLALEAAIRFVHGARARILVGLVVLAALALIWAELAVGLFH